jgi:hypothetical protein
MPSRFALLAVALLLTGLSACSDRPVPTAPAGAGQSPAAASPAQERMRRLARTVARALADSGVRSRLRSELIQSPFAEQKLYFQGLLARSNHRFLQDVARASGTSENQIRDDAANALSLEIYLPLAAHRAAWKGDDRILVATAITDEEAPVAYDTRGREHALDPRVPPSLPVVALVPVETDFSRNRPATATCTPETCTPGGGGSGGGGGGATPPAPGLYMTYAHTLFHG